MSDAAGSDAIDAKFPPLLRSEVLVGSWIAPTAELSSSLGGLRGLGRCWRTVVVKQGGREAGEARLLFLAGLGIRILTGYTHSVPLVRHRRQWAPPSHCGRGRREVSQQFLADTLTLLERAVDSLWTFELDMLGKTDVGLVK